MTKHDLKELAAMGAELGAAKAEIQTLRTALLAIDQRNDNPARFDQEIDKIVRAALSQQAEPQQSREAKGLLPEWWMEQHTEPSDTFTAVDMATAAAQGFRDGQAAVEQAPAHTEQQPVVYAVHGKGLAVDRDCALISPDEAGDYMPGCVTALYAAPIAQTAPKGLRIVLDGPPGPEAGRFVEIENPAGYSVNAGEWRERTDGLWELVLHATAPQPEQSGLVGQVCGGDSQHNTVNVAVVGTVPWNDLPLGTPVRLIRAPALSAQGAGDADS